MNFLETLIGSPSTIRTYRMLFNKNILPFVSEEQAKSFTENDLIQLLAKWEHLHPRTKKMLIILIERYVTFCGGNINSKRVKASVSRSIPIDEIKSLTKKELRTILAFCEKRNQRLYEVLLIAAYTGMRKGEIFGLEYRDIDLENKRILIQRSYNSPYTKNRTPRVVQMPPLVYEFLSKRNLTGIPLDTKIFTKFDPNKKLRRVCTRTKVKKVTIHAFRHTFATLALDAKKSIKQVQSALGHKSLKTTLDIYWNKNTDILDVDFL